MTLNVFKWCLMHDTGDMISDTTDAIDTADEISGTTNAIDTDDAISDTVDTGDTTSDTTNAIDTGDMISDTTNAIDTETDTGDTISAQEGIRELVEICLKAEQVPPILTEVKIYSVYVKICVLISNKFDDFQKNIQQYREKLRWLEKLKYNVQKFNSLPASCQEVNIISKLIG